MSHRKTLTTSTPQNLWEVSEPRCVYDANIFRLCTHRVKRDSFEADYHFLECSDWVNVIALTPANEVVMIEQYRTTLKQSFLELPGGLIDPTDLDPESGARRELEEETGYTAAHFEPLCPVYPNPAIQNNRGHYYLAHDARGGAVQNLDHGEDIQVVLVPLREIPNLITSGKLTHALMLAAFAQLFARFGIAEGGATP